MTVDELIQRLMSVPGDMRVLVCGHELYEMILNMGDFKVYPPELSTCTVVGGEKVIVIHMDSPDE
jgi:hypothetical protein